MNWLRRNKTEEKRRKRKEKTKKKRREERKEKKIEEKKRKEKRGKEKKREKKEKPHTPSPLLQHYPAQGGALLQLDQTPLSSNTPDPDYEMGTSMTPAVRVYIRGFVFALRGKDTRNYLLCLLSLHSAQRLRLEIPDCHSEMKPLRAASTFEVVRCLHLLEDRLA